MTHLIWFYFLIRKGALFDLRLRSDNGYKLRMSVYSCQVSPYHSTMVRSSIDSTSGMQHTTSESLQDSHLVPLWDASAKLSLSFPSTIAPELPGKPVRGKSTRYLIGNIDPSKYKTAMCRNWEATGVCAFRGCTFAHGKAELRIQPPRTTDGHVHPSGNDGSNSLPSNYLHSSNDSSSPMEHRMFGPDCLKLHLNDFETIPEKQETNSKDSSGVYFNETGKATPLLAKEKLRTTTQSLPPVNTSTKYAERLLGELAQFIQRDRESLSAHREACRALETLLHREKSERHLEWLQYKEDARELLLLREKVQQLENQLSVVQDEFSHRPLSMNSNAEEELPLSSRDFSSQNTIFLTRSSEGSISKASITQSTCNSSSTMTDLLQEPSFRNALPPQDSNDQFLQPSKIGLNDEQDRLRCLLRSLQMN